MDSVAERLGGKIAIISGAAGGLGEATARRFIAEGACVALGDIDVDRGQSLARELGDRALFVKLDVTKEADWRAATATLRDRFGALTTLVNAAGIMTPRTIEDETFESFMHLISINLGGALLGCKIGVEAMRAGHGFAIVNIASTLAVRSSSLLPAYCSSKAAVLQLTRSSALFCAEKGFDIRVNVVLPGPIAAGMTDQIIESTVAMGAERETVLAGILSAVPLKRLGKAEEVANAIAFLASDFSSFITGTDLIIDGGVTA